MALFIFLCSTIISCLISIYLIFNFQDQIYNHDAQFFNHKFIFFICFIILFLANISGSAYLNLIITISITNTIAYLIGKYISKRIFILNAIFLFTVTIIEELTYSLVSIILGHDLINMKLIIGKNLVLIILSKSFILLIYKISVERWLKKNYNYLKSTHTLILIYTFLLLIICIVNISMIAIDYPTAISVISSLFVFIIFLAVLSIVNKMETNDELSKDIIIKDSLIDQMKSNYTELFEKYRKDRKLIHDFKKHLCIIDEMQLDTRLDMHKYINDVMNSLDKEVIVKIEENSILPVIFSTYKKRCAVLKIDLKINTMNLEIYSITSVDWVIILGNILDNAIENINTNDPKIIIDFKRNEKFLIISICNTYRNNLIINNNMVISSKKDKLEHGYGIENVKLIVKKYKGDYQLKVNDDNMFEFNIIIPLYLIHKSCI